MSIRRVLAGAASTLAVGGCAAIVVAMAAAAPHDTAAEVAPLPTLDPAASSVLHHPGSTAVSTRTTAVGSSGTGVPRSTVTSTAAATRPAPRAASRTTSAAPAPRPSTPAGRPSTPSYSPPAVRGGSLPLSYSTGSATRVITVVASSSSSTTATLQAWVRAPGGGWLRSGGAVLAHVGAQGIGTASETRSVTPAGSWTLTQAFGADANPGSALPYFQTTSADWWISQAGALYNTHQHCSGSCPFTQGSPNEHLYYERPYYDYAAVIDYNTRDAPGGVRPGAGSAFFLHVTDGRPTAGCVAVPASAVVSLLRWLAPSSHPRILIGVS